MDTTTPMLTPEQRRQLIEQPLAIRTVGGSSWGGRGVASDDGLHRICTPRIAADDDALTLGGDNHHGE